MRREPAYVSRPLYNCAMDADNYKVIGLLADNEYIEDTARFKHLVIALCYLTVYITVKLYDI